MHLEHPVVILEIVCRGGLLTVKVIKGGFSFYKTTIVSYYICVEILQNKTVLFCFFTLNALKYIAKLFYDANNIVIFL